MRINVSEEYREEFEAFISEYQQLCDEIIDLVINNVPIETLKEYCRHKHQDIMWRLTDAVSLSDIMRGIAEKCRITNITPLEKVIKRYITEEERMIEDYQCFLDNYLLTLRARYLLGSSKDIVYAEEIIFILDWTPDEASFSSIKCLLHEAFHYLDKKIIVPDTGRKILHLFNIYLTL